MTHVSTVAIVALLCASASAQAPHPTGQVQPPAPRVVDPNGPRISSPQPVFDFGEAPQREKVEIEFVIENKGKAMLDIIRVNPTCGCTVAQPEKNRLEPGESTKVKSTLDTQTFDGPITKSIVVESNDLSNPRFNLTITGRVKQAFSASVKEVNFGTLRKGTAFPAATFDVLTAGGMSATILDVQSDTPSVKAKFDRLPTNGAVRGFRVTVTIEGSPPVGQLRGTLTVLTDLKSQQQLAVAFSAVVEGEVVVKPRQFNFGSVKVGDTSVVREIEITKTGEAPLVIENLELKPEGLFVAELVEVKAGREYKVKITPAANIKPGYQRCTLTIRTNVPGEDAVAAYFYAMVKAD